MKEGLFSRWGKRFDRIFSGVSEEDSESQIEELQKATKRELDLADSRVETATTAIAAADMQRKNLSELIAQHEIISKKALLMEREGNQETAKKILALQLALEEKIKVQTDQCKSADKMAKDLILRAKKQVKAANEASQDLPRKVLQGEINRMMIRSRNLEKSAESAVSRQTSFKALASSMDLSTAKLMARNLIESSDDLDLDERVDQAIKETEFTEAYKLLQAKVQGGETVEVRLIEDNPADEARKLLSAPAFGGVLSGCKNSPEEVEIEDTSEEG